MTPSASGPNSQPLVLLLLAFFITRVWLLMLAATSPRSFDVTYYGILAQQGVDAGEVAYRDFEVEYPPVAWWLMAVPRLIDSKSYPDLATNPETAERYFSWYSACFRGELCLIDVACLVLAIAVGRKASPRAWWLLPASYVLVTFAQPHLTYDRLDLGLLFFFLLFIHCWLSSLESAAWAEGWASASYLVLGLGISFKIMPVVFVPFLLLADLRSCQRRSTIAGRFLLLLLGAVGPFLAQAPSAGWGVLELFRYHGLRGIHLESIWASVALVARQLGLPCQVVFSHGGFNLTGPLSPALRIASNVALVTMGAWFGLWAVWQAKRFDRRMALDTGELVLINSVVLAKVYSPQYLIWTVPLALLLALNVFPPGRLAWWAFAVLTVAIVEISAWLFPHHYPEFGQLQDWPVALSVTRSVLLVALALLLNVSFFARYGLAPRKAGGTGPATIGARA